ncbi:MAG: beta-lactamase family protein [Clostridia bacterium]|nr:beta-lactamase family protein [Clostridia bacterium]
MADFSALKAYMDRLPIERDLPAGDIIVYHKGEQVFRYLVGYADGAKTVPLAEDNLYMLYSCSKPITVAAALQMMERGLLGLDDPVMKYLPEYADAYVIEDGEKVVVGHTMTVRHLMTMSAGFDYNVNKPAVVALREQKPDATTREMVAAFVQEPLQFRPGARWEYSLCLDVLVAVAEVACGQRFGEYLQENIFAPLGAKDITYWPDEEQRSRIAAQYVCTQDKTLKEIGKDTGGFLLSGQYESGGAGLYATNEALGRFVAAMSCGGVAADGTRILQEKSVELMHTEQLKGFLDNPGYGSGAGPNYGYGLGVRTLLNRNNGEPSHVGEFGWDGAAGAYVLMDPDAQVGIAYCQHTKAWPFMYWGIHNEMRDLVYAALGVQ